MITCTTSITILRRERAFLRLNNHINIFTKTAYLLENKFLFTKSQVAITLKKTQIKLGKLRNYFLAWIETLDDR